MKSVIWGDERTEVIRGKHWDIKFYPIDNQPRKVLAILYSLIKGIKEVDKRQMEINSFKQNL